MKYAICKQDFLIRGTDWTTFEFKLGESYVVKKESGGKVYIKYKYEHYTMLLEVDKYWFDIKAIEDIMSETDY